MTVSARPKWARLGLRMRVRRVRASLLTAFICGAVVLCNAPAIAANDSPKVVTVGAILSLSGLFSTLGPPEKDAILMSADKINANGGFIVDGHRYDIRVKILDDESQPATVGISDYRQLVQVDKVPILIMGVGTPNYVSMFKRAPVPVLNILDSTYPSILGYSKEIFLLRSDTPAYVPGAVWYAKNVLHKDRIGFIGAAADPYSGGIETWVKRSANKYGVKIVSDVNYPPGTTDFSPFIQKTMSAKPDVIYLGGVTQEVLPVAKQLYESGVRGIPVIHNAGATPTQARQIIGDKLYNDVMQDNYDFAGSLPETSTNPATKVFYDGFRKKYGIYPDDLTMWAYDSMYVVTEAMQRAGTVSDRDRIYQAMLSMPVPKQSISGWIPTSTGKLFHGRDARTFSEGVGWCPDTKTIAPVFIYFLKGFDFTHKQIVENGCNRGRH